MTAAAARFLPVHDEPTSPVPARFWWLFINLLTAILASAVIKQFDATIEHMVALAVLMPIAAQGFEET
mgnify:CR=1 FL=1